MSVVLTPDQRIHLPLAHRIDDICTSGYALTKWEIAFLREIQRQVYLTRKQFDMLARIEKRVFYNARV